MNRIRLLGGAVLLAALSAAALAGAPPAPHTATSQFYINLGDNTNLDPRPDRWGYAVFGKVVEGMKTISRIASVPTGPAGPFRHDAPQTPVIINKASVLGAPAGP